MVTDFRRQRDFPCRYGWLRGCVPLSPYSVQLRGRGRGRTSYFGLTISHCLTVRCPEGRHLVVVCIHLHFPQPSRYLRRQVETEHLRKGPTPTTTRSSRGCSTKGFISLGLKATLHTSQAVVRLRLAFPLPNGMPGGSLVLDNYGLHAKLVPSHL